MFEEGDECDDNQQEYHQNGRHHLPARNAAWKPWGECRPETPAVSDDDTGAGEPPF